ncbi:protein TPX2 [Malania oleifera]|uniref:protein TPX2 n=1 Tax=Malania oleifera TaxID=397392 RepID=UPI0025ADD7BC|nr:protein TPX2 [Malania oleifera]
MEGEMAEEMDFIVEDAFDSEIDLDYEFDAVRCFDFSRPESHAEAREAESWFESAGTYPPSPFVIKLIQEEDIDVENLNSSPSCKESENMSSIRNDSDISMAPEVSVDENNREHIPKDKMVSAIWSSLSRSSTLMKPTASVLAKQNKPREANFTRFLRRFQKPCKISEKSSKNHPVIDNPETKRQKLETGYLRKVAHLKHQSLLLHKVPKMPGHLDHHNRKRVTIPREPDLETAQRAHRHRPKNNVESDRHAKPNARPFKARPLNRKILEAPSLPFPKKSTPQLPEFQVFHLKTAERALQHTSDNATIISRSLSHNESINITRESLLDALTADKSATAHKFKGQPLNEKEFKVPSYTRLLCDPPVDLFNKLSLTSEVHPKPLLPAKCSKENAPSCFHQEVGMINEVKEKPRRFGGKQTQCGVDQRIPKIGHRASINRSLDIR